MFRSDKPWTIYPWLFIAKIIGITVFDEHGFHMGAQNQVFLDILRDANNNSLK